jgi:hypothetical protein
MDVYESVRHRWDEGTATLDLSLQHFPHTKAQEATWNAALTRHLSSLPVRILDVGAGALSARRFCAYETVCGLRTVAHLLDLGLL